jgi:hypothetical protein
MAAPAAPAVVAHAHNEDRSPRLSFRGTGENIVNFMKQVDSALINRPEINTHPRRIAYVVQFLSDAALSWYFEWLGAVDPAAIAGTYAQFKADITNAFTNAHDVTSARMELLSLKFESFNTVEAFYAKFHSICIRLPEPDNATRAFGFIQYLPSAMRAFVLERAPVTALAAKTAACVYQGAHAHEAQANKNPFNPTSSVAMAAELHATDAITVGSMREIMAELAAMMAGDSRGPRSPSRYPSHNPKQHVSNTPKRSYMPPADKERCVRENRCFNCKKPNHAARDCHSSSSSTFPPLKSTV